MRLSMRDLTELDAIDIANMLRVSPARNSGVCTMYALQIHASKINFVHFIMAVKHCLEDLQVGYDCVGEEYDTKLSMWQKRYLTQDTLRARERVTTRTVHTEDFLSELLSYCEG